MKLSLLLAALAASVSASNVIELEPSNWDSIVGKGRPGLVEFSVQSSLCEACKIIGPIIEKLADVFANRKDEVFIGTVDTDGPGRLLEDLYKIKDYPALLWMRPDGTAEPYEGGGDLESFVRYVTEKTNVAPPIKLPPVPTLKMIDYNDFDEIVMDPENNVLISFTTQWCDHCKAIKLPYAKVAQALEPDSNCIVVGFDAGKKSNEDIVTRIGVESVPTLMFFPKDNKQGEKYDGALVDKDILEFLNEKCGTHRTLEGDLLDTAGRHAQLDLLAKKFFAASSIDRESIYQQALTISSTIDDPANTRQYTRVMENLVNGTKGYFQKESERLDNILAKRTLARNKLDEIKIKSNILRAFGKPEELDDDDEEEDTNIRRSTAEL